jgi:hypothetical protein
MPRTPNSEVSSRGRGLLFAEIEPATHTVASARGALSNQCRAVAAVVLSIKEAVTCARSKRKSRKEFAKRPLFY